MTKVKCNGFLMEPIKITRLSRVALFSAQLYTLVAEPLGLMIKKDKDIQGIRIGEGKKRRKRFFSTQMTQH